MGNPSIRKEMYIMDKKQTHSIYYDDIKSCAYYSKGDCMLRDDMQTKFIKM